MKGYCNMINSLPGRPNVPDVPVAVQGFHGGQRAVHAARRHARRQGRGDAQVRFSFYLRLRPCRYVGSPNPQITDAEIKGKLNKNPSLFRFFQPKNRIFWNFNRQNWPRTLSDPKDRYRSCLTQLESDFTTPLW